MSFFFAHQEEDERKAFVAMVKLDQIS
jgi:hypothetical protein